MTTTLFGLYVSCFTNLKEIEVITKPRINDILKNNNFIFFKDKEYFMYNDNYIIPFFLTNKIDDYYQTNKWDCFCYIIVSPKKKTCTVLHSDIIYEFNRHYTTFNRYYFFMRTLYEKIKEEKMFDNEFNVKFIYTIKSYEHYNLPVVQKEFDFIKVDIFNFIRNNLFDISLVSNIDNLKKFRDVEKKFYLFFALEYKNSTCICEKYHKELNHLKQELNIKTIKYEDLQTENIELRKNFVSKMDNLLERTKFQEDFITSLKSKMDTLEIPIFDKQVMNSYDDDKNCSICTEPFGDKKCVYVESSIKNPWDYSNQKEPILEHIEITEKFECGHVFHTDCILSWLNTKRPESVYTGEDNQVVYCEDDYTYKTCPLCKRNIIRLINWNPIINDFL